MYKNKKHNVFFLTGILLFTIYLASTMVMSGLFAKYSTAASAQSSVTVANFNMKLKVTESDTEKQILGAIDYDFEPGEDVKLDIDFDGSGCDVGSCCTILFDVIGDLPLAITYKGNDVTKTGITFDLEALKKFSLNEITIKWNGDKTDFQYNGKTSIITVSVVIVQAS